MSENLNITTSPHMFRYWGKADPNYAGEPKWHPLVYHCMDVAAVGIEYLRRAQSVRALLMRELRIENEKALERWTAFWLASTRLSGLSSQSSWTWGRRQRGDIYLYQDGEQYA